MIREFPRQGEGKESGVGESGFLINAKSRYIASTRRRSRDGFEELGTLYGQKKSQE